MRFLKTLFWLIAAAAAMIFAMHNWTVVTVNLWDGLELDAKLPVLILAAFLLGMLPPFILHRATRWSLGRKLESAERMLAEVHGRAAGEGAPGASGEALPPPVPAR